MPTNAKSSKLTTSQALSTDLTISQVRSKPTNIESVLSTEPDFMDTITRKQEHFFDFIAFKDNISDEISSLLDQFEPPDVPPMPPDANILHIVNDTFTSSVILDSSDGNFALEMTIDD